MNSSRLKLVLIIMFLSVNLFFLHKIIDINNAKSTFTDKEIAEAVELVSTKGVNISPENVLRDKTTPKTLKLEWDVHSIDKVVRKITDSEYGSFTIPDGHSFTNDTEQFSAYYDYSFEYTCNANSDNAESVAEILASADQTNENKIKEYNKLLKDITDITEAKDFYVSVQVDKYVHHNEKEYLHAVQYINGCRIDEAEFVAVFSNGRLSFAKGIFYFSGKVSKYVTDAHDSINILFELESNEKEIIKAEQTYFPIRENNTSLYLTPSYKFTYEDGTTVLYDATAGIKRK